MRILITGATGLVGNEIVKQCHAKQIAINYLTTRKAKISNKDNYKGFYWNPNKGEIDTNCIKNVDMIIHLVGDSISKRWTKEQKQAILDSRIKTTKLLYDTVKNNSNNITQIVSASAIGYYPNSLTNHYTEAETKVNTSFLGQVVEAWERAVDTFKTLNIIVSKVRIGLVFSKKGGAFPQIVKPIKYGAGAPLGSGEQWMSWIHIEDLASLFLHVIENKLEGLYNGVSPNPVTNKELTKAAAKKMKKSLFLPNVPKFVLKLALGEMHIILFESQRVSSKKIQDTGFNFEYSSLDRVLESLL